MRASYRWLPRCAVALVTVTLCGATAALAQDVSGPDVWASNCGACHRLRSVETYTASQWNTVATHMALVARLTPAETRAVREFLVGSARTALAPGSRARRAAPPAPEFASGAEKAFVASAAESNRNRGCCPPGAGAALFRTRCAPCHGAEGRGNGPAAAAMNPRPTNLADPAPGTAVADSAQRAVIERGRRAMPAFGRLLNQAQIDTLAFFLRQLRQQ
jgi:mono/diheme cytochrome c family protein